MDPKQFMKNTIAKELLKIKANVASLNSPNQTMQQSVQANIEELIEKINTWSDSWRADNTQQLSSEQIILAVGRGHGIPADKASKRKSPISTELEELPVRLHFVYL